MWEQIETLITSTPLVQGGLLVALSGLLFEQVRRVPSTVWGFIIRRATVTLTVGNEFDIYPTVLAHVQKLKQGKFRSIGLYGKQSSFGSRVEWGFYRGRLYSVFKTREKSTGGYSKPVVSETLTFTFYTFNPKLVEQFIEEIITAEKGDESRYLRLPGVEDWFKASTVQDRALSTVILPEGTIEQLIADYESFTAKREFYAQLGIPYRRGYLLEGPPGTGKTSLVKALATKYNKDIHVLGLGRTSDGGLADAMRELRAGAFVLVEDIDSLFNKREKTGEGEEARVSFSGLLNALDGIEDSQGRVLFVTTNHKERLDPALFRPGRLDYHVRFDYLTPEQASRYLTLFYGQPTEVSEVPQMTVAELQEICLTNSREAACSTLKNLGTTGTIGATQ